MASVWIKIEGNIDGKFRPLLVFSSEEAARLSEGNAQQVVRAAADAYPKYAWRHFRLSGFDQYVVEGLQKGAK